MKAGCLLAVWCLAISGSVSAADAVPKYKPSARSPAPLDITTAEYGFSRNAPAALTIGDVAPDFNLPRAGGGTVSLRSARVSGPVVLIFYRGHW